MAKHGESRGVEEWLKQEGIIKRESGKVQRRQRRYKPLEGQKQLFSETDEPKKPGRKRK